MTTYNDKPLLTPAGWILRPGSQVYALARALRAGRHLTNLTAFELCGTTRLSARVHELRVYGFDILTERVTMRNRYDHPTTFARYRLRPGSRRGRLLKGEG